MAWTRRDIPNALTMARLVLAAVFFVMLALAGPGSMLVLVLAACVFIIAALTDALDGYLARRWDAISPFGRVMDPFADKILVLGGFVMLAGPNFVLSSTEGDTHTALLLSGVAPWMPVVILARELLITSIRGVFEAKGIDFSASASGKAKMIAQSVAIPLTVLIIALHESIGTDTAARLNTGIAWFVVVLTAFSALPYLTRAAQHADAVR